MKPKILGAVLASAFLAIAAVAGWVASSGQETTQASPALTLGVDADPTGNTATSLATIDECVSVSVGATFAVDIFISDVVDLLAWEAYVGYHPSVLKVIGVDVDSADTFLAANAGSRVLNLSDSVPGTDGVYRAAGVDIAEPPTHDSGQGVLARLMLEAIGPGVSSVNLPLLDLDGDTSTDLGPFVRNLGGELLGDGDGDGFFDGPIANAWVAVGQACPSEPPPTPSPTPSSNGSPTPSPTPTRTPTPTPTAIPTPVPWPTPPPPPGTVYLVGGWNDSCHVGPAQPIETALATIAHPILALYRMRPDQGFDSWFPARPDLSTITTLNPYDQLFILMAQDATWTHQPSDTPPTSASLTAGWNSVCYAGTAKDIEAATATIAGQFGIIYTLASDQTWRRFVPAKPELSNLSQLQHSTSVLILITQQNGALWVFEP